MEEQSATEGLLLVLPYCKSFEDYPGIHYPKGKGLNERLSSNKNVIIHDMPVRLPELCRAILHCHKLTNNVLVIAPYPTYVLEIMSVMKELGVEPSVKVETCDAINSHIISTFEVTDVNVAVGTPGHGLHMVKNGISYVNTVFYYSGNELVGDLEVDEAASMLLDIVQIIQKFQREVRVFFFSERALSKSSLSSLQDCFQCTDVFSSGSVPKSLNFQGIKKHEYRMVNEENKWETIWFEICKTLDISKSIDICEVDIHNMLNLVNIRAIIYVDHICLGCSSHASYHDMCCGFYGLSSLSKPEFKTRCCGFYGLPFLEGYKTSMQTKGNIVRNLVLNSCVLIASRILVRNIIETFAEKVELIINYSTPSRLEYLQRMCSFPNVSTAITFATKGELFALCSLQIGGSSFGGFSFEDRYSLAMEMRKDDVVAAAAVQFLTDPCKALEHMKNRKNRRKTVEDTGEHDPFFTWQNVEEINNVLEEDRDVIFHNLIEPGVGIVEQFWSAILSHPWGEGGDSLPLVIVPNHFYVSKIVTILQSLCRDPVAQVQSGTFFTIVSGHHLGTPVRVAVATPWNVTTILRNNMYHIDMVVFYWGNESINSEKEWEMYDKVKEVVDFLDCSQGNYFKIVIFSERKVVRLELLKEFLCDVKEIISPSSLDDNTLFKKHRHEYAVVEKEVDRVDYVCNIVLNGGELVNTIIYVEEPVVCDSLIKELDKHGISTTKTKAYMSHKELISALSNFTRKTHVLITPRVWAREIIPCLGEKVRVISFSTVEPPEYFLRLYLFEEECTAIMFVSEWKTRSHFGDLKLDCQFELPTL